MIPEIMKTLATAALLAGLMMINMAVPVLAADYPYPGTVTVSAPHQFDTLVMRLEKPSPTTAWAW